MAGKDWTEVLIITRGHAFDRNAFAAMFDFNTRLQCTTVEQPAAQILVRPENVGTYDAILFYDMMGFYPPRGSDVPMGTFMDPPEDYKASIEALLEAGTGMVLLNHGAISWPTWPLWRELTGTSFMIRDGELNGKQVPGSGFRGGAGHPEENTTMRVTPATPGHPVLAGLDDSFEITDELYLKTADYESDVVPLLRSDFEFIDKNFMPPPLAPPEEQAAWSHPPGSDLVAWAKATRNSAVVGMDLGDGTEAFENEKFRLLLTNALEWVGSKAGREWAASQ